MVEFGGKACGTTPVAIASTAGPWGMYPTRFLGWRTCGSAWEQNDRGSLVRRRVALTHA